MKKSVNKANALLIPLTLVFVLLFIIPFFVLFYYSFLTRSSGQVVPSTPYTVSSYLRFFEDSYYPRVVGRTLWLSLLTAGICVVLGYPVAYYITKARGYWKTVLMVVVILPLVSGVITQTLGLYGMLTSYGPVNNFLMWAGILKEPVEFLGTTTGVVIGLTQGFLPYMILTVMNAIQAIPDNVLEAADNLGANGVQRFFLITLPLSKTGVAAGFVLVFGCCLNSYTTPLLLGRGKISVIGTAIYQQAMELYNWPFASAIAMILIALVLVVFALGNTLPGVGGRKKAVSG
ncbi:MAG: ABC transporter permease [Oscillibacter sp.]|nr:ABC transporter permease [Oscillibacter sp.]MCI9001629.1 ABC transporter permease [Oscillibacter sp.]